jgi:4-amino-4-deoxy-L-arabinose transferase-like glycosyltransferase
MLHPPKKHIYQLFFVGALLALHIPFLQADADINITSSRAAWTDEGIYSLQIRNWLNGFGFSIVETDAFLRTPLFNISVLPFYFLFGIHLWVVRWLVLTITLITAWFLLHKQFIGQWTWPFLVYLLLNFQLFQHCHLGLAEVPAICLILLSLLLYKQNVATSKISYLPYIGMLIAAGYKISFAFAPAIFFLLQFSMWLFASKEHKLLHQHMLYRSLLVNIIGSIIFLSCWYWPNQDFIRHILSIQTEVSLSTQLETNWLKLKSNYEWYAAQPHFKVMFYLFKLNMVGLVILGLIRKRIVFSNENLILLIFSILWLLFEAGKFANNYLPSRYLLSAIAANLLLLFVMADLFIQNTHHRKYAILFSTFAGVMLFLPSIYNSYVHRSFQLAHLNTYLAKTIIDNKYPVMGNWAASCTWECKVALKPLSSGVHNHIETLKLHHPQLVITEPDEADSDKLFERQSVNLKQVADSVVTTNVAHWNLNLYWLSR